MHCVQIRKPKASRARDERLDLRTPSGRRLPY
jgi:hypothetical protein